MTQQCVSVGVGKQTTGILNYAFDRASMRLKREKIQQNGHCMSHPNNAASARKPVLLYTTFVHCIVMKEG